MFANCKCEELSYPKNQKIYEPILVTLLKMQPHYSQSSHENATPSSGTSPLASYNKYPPSPRDSDSTAGKQGLVSSSNPPDGYQQLHLTTK